MRASGAPSAGTAVARSCGKRRKSSHAQLGALPAGTRLLIGFDLPIVDDADQGSGSDAAEVDELHEVSDGSDEPESAQPDRAHRVPNGRIRPPFRATSGLAVADQRAPGIHAIVIALASLRRKGFARLLMDGAQ